MKSINDLRLHFMRVWLARNGYELGKETTGVQENVKVAIPHAFTCGAAAILATIADLLEHQENWRLEEAFEEWLGELQEYAENKPYLPDRDEDEWDSEDDVDSLR